ncbi:hypothetical protein DL766_005112 [Monosporascus sp. MC13-8B]|uniref:Zn(2)-C6 fungal-type domain-containing protein n=1 Tax=Monosporascus cannonballus TaxID=155416 RepID=A0ABY0HG86_9PEZI|nr:hypothetical protein DL762_002937 [Monosporascus cannonballus]RYO97265.1 hypothetical protein DL763_002814 [Monosporascus cannonballus]RYP29966.1 hypothetical protein DL766_005112 [Monosporascus sp. MC13-8B]
METDEASSKRQRRAHRKSRLGCLQCKKRKIKCDETRPSCLNCIRREITCSPRSTPIDGAGLVAQTSPGHPQMPYRRGIWIVPDNVTSDCSIPCGNHGSSPGTAPSLSDQSSHQIQLLSQRLTIVESQLLAVISAPPSSHLPGLTYSDMEL